MPSPSAIRSLYMNSFLIAVIQVLKLDPDTGEIVCSIKLPALQVSNLAFGKCAREKRDELRCLYVTTTSTNDNPSSDDGAFYRIENVGALGVLPDKIRFGTIFGGPGLLFMNN